MFNMKVSTQHRRLLQEEVNGDAMDGTVPPTTSIKRPFKPSSPFDSSMALTTLVLLTALFFMGFFSLFLRRFSLEDTNEVRRRRHPSSPSSRLLCHQKGVDPSSIKALPLVSYGGAAKQGIIEDDCTICLSEFQEGEMVKLIPHCRHVFHPTCIDTWLGSHVSCPLCRSTQLFKTVDEVCLDVVQDKNGNGVSDTREGSASDDSDTWSVVTSGVRRSRSCSSLGERVVLQRSLSF